MKKVLTACLVVFVIAACSSTKNLSKAQLRPNGAFVITEISTDDSYGLSPENPVEVGGVDKSEGPTNERRYLDALAGPNGERLRYFRAGSCCPVKSDNGFSGIAMLDNYRVTWEGANDTISIFINMYDYGELKAPVGFTIKE